MITEMLPLVREHGTPVTLFIYPSAISNASYAMTWEQLATLAGSGLFAIQSHTFWHPRFDLEKQRLAAADYREFVTMQLVGPRSVIKARLGVDADLISWPFGIADDELLQKAAECGYVAGVTLGERPATAADSMMALPRFLITDKTSRASFAAIVSSGAR